MNESQHFTADHCDALSSLIFDFTTEHDLPISWLMIFFASFISALGESTEISTVEMKHFLQLTLKAYAEKRYSKDVEEK